MQNIIFLSQDYKALLDGAGVSLDILLPDTKYNILSNEDSYNIDYMTNKARSYGGLLFLYGLGFENGDSTKVNTFVPKTEIDNEVVKISNMKTELGAYCPNKDTIILWQQQIDEDNISHHMFKANLKVILRAMARVLPVEKVISSFQFELAILRG